MTPFPQLRKDPVVDRWVLIAPEEGEERTKVGLYLPATAVDTQQVQEGHIVATGPGDPVPDAEEAVICGRDGDDD